jgi:SAM-dependent methyltransferase
MPGPATIGPVTVTEEAEPAEESRYDRMAEGYTRFWAPVLRTAAERVLDVLEPDLAARGTTLLDVGSGTGTLAVGALERWPHLRVTGIDPSGGMLDEAGRTAARRLDPAVARRFSREVAPADRLPFRDGTFDAAMSSFVLQLVPSRAAALREIHRVLRPGGVLAWVTWQRSERGFAPDRIGDDVLDEFGFDPPEADQRPGDVASAAAAALAMRRAGFGNVRAWTGEVVFSWDARGYLEFLTLFDEESLFAELEPTERADIERTVLERLEGLSAEELTLRLPVVYAVGRTAG